MYYYILDRENKRVFEFKENKDNGNKIIFLSMGIKLHNDFPYMTAGYEDPYAFMEDYELIKFSEDRGEVEVQDV